MDNRGYIIVDGSHLFSCIGILQKNKTQYADKKLDIGRLTDALTQTWSIAMGNQVVRVVYYFKPKDTRISSMLEIPQVNEPGKKDHWQIKQCGQSLKTIPDKEIQKLSPKYRDYYPRAEKGLDVQLTCDVLMLVARGVAANIVFLVNDRDYIPLFETIQQLGANTYITSLSKKPQMQKRLAEIADKYQTLDTELDVIFGMKSPTGSRGQLSQSLEFNAFLDSEDENDTW